MVSEEATIRQTIIPAYDGLLKGYGGEETVQTLDAGIPERCLRTAGQSVVNKI